MSYATCHTSGCGNENQTLDVGDLTFTDDDGNTGRMAVECGVCGQFITDITDAIEEG